MERTLAPRTLWKRREPEDRSEPVRKGIVIPPLSECRSALASRDEKQMPQDRQPSITIHNEEYLTHERDLVVGTSLPPEEHVPRAPLVSFAASRWRRVSDYTTRHMSVIQRLKASAILGNASDLPRTRADRYLGVLRSGVKHLIMMDGVARVFDAHSTARAAAEATARAILEQRTVVQVTTVEELEALPLWQQGDVSLATEEKLLQRQKLRWDRRVLEVLQAFWEAAVNSLRLAHEACDGDETTLHREGHALMLRRIYRVMIKDYDPQSAESAIGEDWERDAKGGGRLSRRHFGDAIFECALPITVRPCPSHAHRLAHSQFAVHSVQCGLAHHMPTGGAPLHAVPLCLSATGSPIRGQAASPHSSMQTSFGGFMARSQSVAPKATSTFGRRRPSASTTR